MDTPTNKPAMLRTRTETVSSTEISAAASMSVSENQTVEVPKWFPRCCGKPVLHGNREALGFVLGMTGQMVILYGGLAFIVPALMYLAKLEAGCEVEIPEGETSLPECNKTVHGLRPSSLITTVASILSLLMALLHPLNGALVDYTRRRLQLARVLAVALVCIMSGFIFINSNNWFILTCCLILMICVETTLTLLNHAYLPELTDNEEELNDFTKAIMAVPGVGNIIFIVVIMGVSIGLGMDGEVETARIAAIGGVVVMATCFAVTWGFLMQPRPPLNTLEEGEMMLTQGFKQLYRTATKLYRTNISLTWFFAAVALADVKPLTTVALTFLDSQQEFDSFDVGIAALILLCSSVPGASLSAFMCRKINPVKSSVLSVICFIVITLAACIFLTSPEQKIQTFVVVAFWGIVGGWKVTSTNMLVAAIIPEGQSAELMGFYLFSDASLSWLPPLIFTAMNQAGYNERLSMAILMVFFVVGLGAYWKMGSYDDCVKRANRLAVTPADTLMAISEDECEPGFNMETSPGETPKSRAEDQA